MLAATLRFDIRCEEAIPPSRPLLVGNPGLTPNTNVLSNGKLLGAKVLSFFTSRFQSRNLR